MATKWRSTTSVRSILSLVLVTFSAAAADEPKDAKKSGTRVAVDKDGSKTRVVVEQDVSVRVEIKQKPTAACEATIDLEYQQRDTVAHVTGAIENATCAASGGDYVLAVTVSNANGEVSTLEFPQEWARSDAESVKFARDLPIGPDVDLKSVRTRRLRCTCAEPAER